MSLICAYVINFSSWNSLVGIVSRLDDPRFDSLKVQKIFLFSKMYRKTLRPSEAPTHWVPKFLAGG